MLCFSWSHTAVLLSCFCLLFVVSFEGRQQQWQKGRTGSGGVGILVVEAFSTNTWDSNSGRGRRAAAAAAFQGIQGSAVGVSFPISTFARVGKGRYPVHLCLKNNNDKEDIDEDKNKNETKERFESSSEMFVVDDNDGSSAKRRDLLINVAAAGLLAAVGVSSWSLFSTELYTPDNFERIRPLQFIAALGDPTATSGSGANQWGLWTTDPGPRGVFLRNYQESIVKNNGLAPAGWKFDSNDWWIDENGILMPSPVFPIAPGRYLVTGGRLVTTGLTIDENGSWKLDNGATLYDVTHLPCRSARYKPLTDNNRASPANANLRDWPVPPGGVMPSIPGCDKVDYSVLFLVGKASK